MRTILVEFKVWVPEDPATLQQLADWLAESLGRATLEGLRAEALVDGEPIAFTMRQEQAEPS